MRFRSVHTLLRIRLAYMTTRENSPSARLCQIVPVKQASMKASGSTFRYASHATKRILLGVETGSLVWTASLYAWLAMIG